MSTKTHYSEADWKAISSAPVAAGLFITLTDASSPIGLAKEALAVGKAIARTASGDAPEIVRVLAEHVRRGGGRPELPDVPAGDRAQAKSALLDGLRTAVQAVQSTSPGEVEAYKTWLASVTAKVAQASSVGGFLGTNGTLVSPDGQDALRQLADVLGVGPPPPAVHRWSHSPSARWRRRSTTVPAGD
jgi:hypothetical protein